MWLTSMSAAASVQRRAQQPATAVSPTAASTATTPTRPEVPQERPHPHAQPAAADNGTAQIPPTALTTEEARPGVHAAAAACLNSPTWSQAPPATEGSRSAPAADGSSTTAVRNLWEQRERSKQGSSAPIPPRTPAGTGRPGSPAPAGGTGARQPLGDLGIAAGGSNAGGGGSGDGSGDAPRGNRDFVLTKERVAAVRCYFRENDPLFIRANLSKLRDGNLKPLAVGDTVRVARRYVGLQTFE